MDIALAEMVQQDRQRMQVLKKIRTKKPVSHREVDEAMEVWMDLLNDHFKSEQPVFDFLCEQDSSDKAKMLVFGCKNWSDRGEGVGQVQRLLEKGADPKSTDEFGSTPLHYRAITADMDSIQVLLDKGADVDAMDAEGDTAMHYICMKGNRHRNTLKTMLFLLAHGATAGAKNKKGKTPIHYLLEDYADNVMELIKTLVKGGADMTPVLVQLGRLQSATNYQQGRSISGLYKHIFNDFFRQPSIESRGGHDEHVCPVCLESVFRCKDACLTLECGHSLCCRCAWNLDRTTCPKCIQEVRWGIKVYR